MNSEVQTKKCWHSNGKLLISGEYLVLKGASSLAVPINKGQSLEVTENPGSGNINWQANHINGKWFEGKFNIGGIREKSYTSGPEFQKLLHIIDAVVELKPNFLNQNTDYDIKTHLEFLPEHGLGSSSTLINNMAKWINCNPYDLLEKTFGGSGYDIACANNNYPLLFKIEGDNRIVETVNFNPPFSDKLLFVYLGKKQKSSESIKRFNATAKFSDKEINRISEISHLLIKASNINEFNNLIEEHEEIMSQILNTKTVKSLLFSDLKGSVKSLGAWGGDFVMLSSESSKTDIEKYLKNKGYNTYFTFNELLLN